MKNLFNLEILAQQAPQLPAQPQVGNAPVPGQAVLATGTGTPAVGNQGIVCCSDGLNQIVGHGYPRAHLV